MRAKLVALSCAALTFALPRAADAFCGFYVGGAGAELFNNATQVVMMRDGTRTVLSMQNNYQGPPSNFAMVVPVPVVLQEENVKTLPKAIFQRVDQLAAPRLVEYWEQDPCMQEEWEEEDGTGITMAMEESKMGADESDRDFGVTIEAEFVVGEYEIVILSAKDSTGLEGWLHANDYTIPKGADRFLDPYVEGGSKFFVAKVDIEKVTMKNGMAELSPLRFHYDSEQFALPVRLGLMNAKGKQDLIVHILAQRQRYETANFPNVFIPTNLDLKEGAKERFGEFYAALFDATLEKHPRAVVTEYSWDASSCDPCPTPALDYAEIRALGGDVIGDAGRGWVLTRLHARYDASQLGEDLVFKKADPVVGGREFVVTDGKLEEGAKPGRINNFQARYAIRHEWTGPIECDDPVRGRWGGPPGGEEPPEPKPAQDLAFAPRGKLALPQVVAEDIPELGVIASAGAPTQGPTGSPAKPSSRKPGRLKKGCSCRTATGGSGAAGLALILAAAMAATRRRKR